LKAAARMVGGIQVQNRGTLAGNLCTASPAADGVPPLLTLEARVEIAARGRLRDVPLSAFITGYRHTTLAPDEIVTALHIPDCAGSGHFLKLGARRYLVISIAMAAAVIAVDGADRITLARLAVGSCSAVAQRLATLEALLVGQPASEVSTLDIDAAIGGVLTPLDDIRGSAAYRRSAAATLIRDLLHGAVVPAVTRAA
jgi:xanthine dehydrogenase small subunit